MDWNGLEMDWNGQNGTLNNTNCQRYDKNNQKDMMY